MNVVESTPVEVSIVVDVPIGKAFDVFTRDIGSWWPADHHILQSELAEMVFEPRVGGQIIDRGIDGSECRWAHVLAYDPPNRLVISWDITVDWQVETERARSSEVEIVFAAVDSHRTQVDLEHRHIERHGDGWEQMHGAVGSDEGWLIGIDRFARRATTGNAELVT